MDEPMRRCAFSAKDIDVMMTSMYTGNAFMPEIYTSIDPHAGRGVSDFAILSIAPPSMASDNRYVVCLSFLPTPQKRCFFPQTT